MSVIARRDRCFALALGLAVGCMALAAPPAGAQTPALYALNQNGTLSLNATVMDELSGSKWVSLVVDGSDRYALRDNGLVFKNGVKLYKLNCEEPDGDSVNEGGWVGMAFDSGSLWALSKGGYLAQDGVCLTQFDPGLFEFSAIFSGTSGLYSMRTDGAVFRNTTATPAYTWEAGPGELDGAGEGEAPDTTWQSGAVGPDGKAYALRRDGKLIRGDIFTAGDGDPANGTVIAELPFSEDAAALYTDFAFTVDGSWNVLRSNGSVFQEPNTLTPLIELNDNDDTFADLIPLPESKAAGTTDTSFMALRRDGALFRETGEATVGELPKSGYGELVLSTDPPDLTATKNALPVVAKYTVQAVTDIPVTFPILATDTDLASADLVVTLDESTLPAGAVYDDVERTVTWAAPVVGSYKIKVEVDDGVGNPVKVTYVVKVKDPDTNREKNRNPRVTKIKNVQGLVGIELVLPILATDQDGDTLTISVDDTAEPFTLGATFDALTNTFTWTDPELSDIDTYKVPFNVSDGTKTVKLTVTIKIVSSLLGF